MPDENKNIQNAQNSTADINPKSLENILYNAYTTGSKLEGEIRSVLNPQDESKKPKTIEEIYSTLQVALLKYYLPELEKELQNYIKNPEKAPLVSEIVYKVFGLSIENIKRIMQRHDNKLDNEAITDLINLFKNSLFRHHQEVIQFKIKDVLEDPQKKPHYVKTFINYLNQSVWSDKKENPEDFMNEDNYSLTEMMMAYMIQEAEQKFNMDKYRKKK